MTKIVIIAAFLLAASATPIQDTSPAITEYHSTDYGSTQHNASSEPPSTNDTDQHHPTDEAPPDVSPNQTALNDTLKPPPEPPQQPFPPRDENPDCNATNKEGLKGMVHLLCLFSCGGDMAEELTNNETCIFNYTEVTTEGYPTGPRGNITGVCQNGQCVLQSTDVTATTPETTTAETNTTTNATETSPETTTAETNTTTDATETSPGTTTAETSTTTYATETSPEPTTAQTTTTTEIKSPESPTNPEYSVVEREITSQPSSSPQDLGPVAMP